MSPPRAKKSLGQNFLVDPNLQKKIVDAVDPAADDIVVEIGPGTGALTRHLVERASRLIAIEKDDALAHALEDELGPRITVLHGDALEVLPDVPAGARVRIVGNIPYNITTPLIFRILEVLRPADAVLMVQREVADRILADPGAKEYGALTVGVRAVADAERLFHVGRGAFRPVPNVDSTVIRITPRPGLLEDHEVEDLRSLTRATFSMRRKQLQKILRTAEEYALDPADVESVLAAVGVAPDARPETLGPGTFVALSRALRARGLPARTPDAAPSEPPGHGELVPLLAHELRSPVAAILGYAELLSDGLYGEVDDRAREGVDRIAAAARQLRALIDGCELLLGDGQPDVDPRPGVDVTERIRELVSEAAPEAGMRGIELSPDLEPVPTVTTDPDALLRSLQLLLGATLRHASGPVSVRVRRDGTGAAITFPDFPSDADAPGAGVRRAMAARLLTALGAALEPVGGGLRVRVPGD